MTELSAEARDGRASSGEAGDLELSLRRTARRSLTACVIIEAVAVVVLLLLHPSLHAAATATGNRLRWLPIGAVILAPIITLRLTRAARRAEKVLDAPPTTAYVTTEFQGMLGRGYVAVLRSTPDGDPFAELRVVYTKPQRYLFVSGAEATVYGPLDPGTAAVAVTPKGAFIGRIR